MQRQVGLKLHLYSKDVTFTEYAVLTVYRMAKFQSISLTTNSKDVNFTEYAVLTVHRMAKFQSISLTTNSKDVNFTEYAVLTVHRMAKFQSISLTTNSKDVNFTIWQKIKALVDNFNVAQMMKFVTDIIENISVKNNFLLYWNVFKFSFSKWQNIGLFMPEEG